MANQSAEKVKKNIAEIHERKVAAVVALCQYYAAEALRYFRSEQTDNRFWTNQTNQAMDTVFSGTIRTDTEVGWGLAHWIEYGVYLELAHSRQNAALRPIVEMYTIEFLNKVMEIY